MKKSSMIWTSTVAVVGFGIPAYAAILTPSAPPVPLPVVTVGSAVTTGASIASTGQTLPSASVTVPGSSTPTPDVSVWVSAPGLSTPT